MNEENVVARQPWEAVDVPPKSRSSDPNEGILPQSWPRSRRRTAADLQPASLDEVRIQEGQTTVIIERTVTYRIERVLNQPELDTETWSTILHNTGPYTLSREIWPDEVDRKSDKLQLVHVSSRVFEEIDRSGP